MHSSFALLLTTALPFAASAVPKDTRSYMSLNSPEAPPSEEGTARSGAFEAAEMELAA